MDQQKKQKFMIAGLAVLILGAGSVFTVRALSGSGDAASDRVRGDGPIGRKQRADTSKSATGRSKRKARKAPKARTTGRKERKKSTKRTTRRKGKKRSKQKRLKKQDSKPMG